MREDYMAEEGLTRAIVEMREDDALAIVERLLEKGFPSTAVLERAREAMVLLGERFELGEVFVPELIMGGEIMKAISERVKPLISAETSQGKRGTIVIGTVAGDIHDIGKDIVVLMLDVNGYEVHDLGIDVAAERFVEAIRSHQPQVVGLSGLLTLAFESMKKTIEAIAAAGLRDQVMIMIGGSPVDQQVADYTGADGWGRDAAAAMSLAAGWTKGA
jgi:methanogenic corrinoid protein MtbC1